MLHSLHEHWLWVWDWLINQGASRATVMLVFITAWYAWLTSRMTRSMGLQTKAMVQPILGVEMYQNKDEPLPKGRWQARNLGDKPVVLVDMRLECRRDSRTFHDEYLVYRNHVLPPGEQVAFHFDFTRRFLDEQGRSWFSHGTESFNVEIVATDLSEQVVLTYRKSLFWDSLSVTNGMPARVRWRIWSDPTRYLYRRQKMRIQRWLKIDELSRLQKTREKDGSQER